MAFNFHQGPQKIQDIVAKSDPEGNTLIDFSDDKIEFIVSGNVMLTITPTSVSSSVFVGIPMSTSSSPVIAGINMIPYIFGDGSDNDATLDGTGSVPWATRSGAIYTMTRDALCKNITINSGIVLRPNNYLPYSTETLTNNGKIETRGNDAFGAVPGAFIGNTGTWWSAGGQGGSGSVNSNGIVGGGSGGASIGGGGGNGGNAAMFTGGIGNASATLSNTHGSYRNIAFLINRRVFSGNNWTAINGSGGGGGGAGNNAGGIGTGGGGGSAAPLCAIAANTLINNGTIQSVGGGGAGGTVSGGGTPSAGGGGGGSGGPIFVFTNYLQVSGTIQSLGGTGGLGIGGATNGTSGSANQVIILKGS